MTYHTTKGEGSPHNQYRASVSGYPSPNSKPHSKPESKAESKLEHLRTNDDPGADPSGYPLNTPPREGKPYRRKRRSLLRGVVRWLRASNEFWGIPIALTFFVGCPILLQWLDVTAGSYDLAVLQSLLYAVLAFWFIKGVTWFLLRLDFPHLYRWLDDQFDLGYAADASDSPTATGDTISAPTKTVEPSERRDRDRAHLAFRMYALYLLVLALILVAIL